MSSFHSQTFLFCFHHDILFALDVHWSTELAVTSANFMACWVLTIAPSEIRLLSSFASLLLVTKAGLFMEDRADTFASLPTHMLKLSTNFCCRLIDNNHFTLLFFSRMIASHFKLLFFHVTIDFYQRLQSTIKIHWSVCVVSYAITTVSHS